jgi:hypothetical protein
MTLHIENPNKSRNSPRKVLVYKSPFLPRDLTIICAVTLIDHVLHPNNNKKQGLITSLSQYFSRKAWEAELKALLVQCRRRMEPSVKMYWRNYALI